MQEDFFFSSVSFAAEPKGKEVSFDKRTLLFPFLRHAWYRQAVLKRRLA